MTTPTDEVNTNIPATGSDIVARHAGGLPEDLETGMDELEEGGYPRLRIDHKERRFVESIGETEYPSIEAILLGFSYSRVMWKPSKPGQGFKSDEMPQCRSNDNKHGQPNTDVEKPVLFPWNDSVFDPMKAQVNPTYNRVLLDCEKCHYQIWGSDGTRPACGLAMNVYVLFQPPGADQPVTAFMTVKGAGIKPMKKFFNMIRSQSRNAAPYQFVVKLGLDVHVSGEVEYCTPSLEVIKTVPPNSWAELSRMYGEMRDFTKNIIIEADDKEIAVNGYVPPRSPDPHFIMSIDQLKEGIDPTVQGGGRRSAPPPPRAELKARDRNGSPLASLMGASGQVIQGSAVPSQAPPQSAPQSPAGPQTVQGVVIPPQAPVQAPTPPPAATQQPQAPIKPEPNLGTPAPQAVAAAAPPPQSATPPPMSSSAFPSFTMPAGMATPAVQAPSGVAGSEPSMPWANQVTPPPASFVPPTTDSPVPDDEVDSDHAASEPGGVASAAFPFS